MDDINKILVELVERISSHFNISSDEAMEAVALAQITNEISNNCNSKNLDIDEISSLLIEEISSPKSMQ